jgi:DNA-binding IclR family transcriptional regulator
VVALGATERSGAQAVERAISVLDCFTTAAPRLGLAQLADLAHLPASTTYRIAQALVRGGLLERHGRDGYQMSLGMVERARPVLSRFRIDAAAPHLYRLAARIKLAVTFGVPADSDLITVLCARPTAEVCEHQLPSGREPLHASAMGKAMLAFGGQGTWAALGDLNHLERFTNRTLTSAEALMADLALTRERGFAVADEERAEDVRAVAVPVISSEGDLAVGVIGVQACSPRLTDQLVRELVPALRYFAREVGRELDGRLAALESQVLGC